MQAIEWSVMSKIRATFIGYQQTVAEPIPLFNVSGGSRHKSTVTLVTLLKEGIDIPYYPRPTAVTPNKAIVPHKGDGTVKG